MPSTEQGVEFPLSLDLSGYTRGITSAISDADDFDDRLARLTGSAQKVEKALNDIDGMSPSVAVSVDDSELDTALERLTGLETNTTAKASVDDSEIDTAVDQHAKLAANTSSKASVDASEIDTAKTKTDALAKAAKISGRVLMSSSDLDDVKAKLEDIKALSVVNVSLAAGDALLNTATSAGGAVVSALTDIDTLVQVVTARTGKVIPNVGETITSLYRDNLGGSKEEVAELIIELSRLGVANENLEDTARNTFNSAAVAGVSPLDVLKSMNQLVTNGVLPNMEEAGDFIAKGFQSGFNASGDFLGSLEEYSSIVREIGLSAGSLFTIMESGLTSGAFNTDKLLDSFKEMGNLTREEILLFNEFGTETDRTKALGELGLVDEATAYAEGAATTDQYIAGALDALRAVEDKGDQRRLAIALFGATAVEDATLGSLLSIDISEDALVGEETWQGVADTGAAILSDTLPSSIEEFLRTFETVFAEAVNKAFDIEGKIEALKTGLQSAVDVLQSGGTFDDAITVGLRPLGLDDEFLKIEAVVGNIVIKFLELLATAQEILPGGSDGSETRAEIARLSAQQLTFDLKSADIDAIPDLVQTALDRGVDASKISDLANQTVVELIDEGDIDRAKELVTNIERLSGTVTLSQLGQTQVIDVTQGLDESVEEFNQRIEGARQAAEAQGASFTFELLPQIDLDAAQDAIDQVTQIARDAAPPEFNQLTALQEAYAANFGATANPNPGGAAGGFTTSALPAATEEVAQSAEELALAQQTADAATAATLANSQSWVDTIAAMQGEFNTSATGIVDSSGDAAEAISDLGATSNEVIVGNTMIEDFAILKESADENFPEVIAYLDTLEAAFTNAGLASSTFGVQASTAISSLGSSAAGAGNPFEGGGSVPAFAEGGTFSGTALVGEEGPELVSSATDVAVLNAATSREIINAMAALIGGGAAAPAGGGRTQNINQVNYVQSPAQAEMTTQKIANAVRGY